MPAPLTADVGPSSCVPPLNRSAAPGDDVNVPVCVAVPSAACRSSVPLAAWSTPSLSIGIAISVVPAPSVLPSVPVLWIDRRSSVAELELIAATRREAAVVLEHGALAGEMLPLCQAIVPWLTKRAAAVERTELAPRRS